uniref:uncharacterized protein LOC122593190 n=1 Tax=Erigeron canadensis TaxID=72917 RepID=UPI001CB899A0|nr:uncharacterized protein LOC122593190 [Erigeron canadensis]
MSLREEENPVGASCPNQSNSRSKRRRRRSVKKVKAVKHYSSDHQKLLVGEGGLTSLREEENSVGASCPNQPNSSKRRMRRSGKKVKWLKHYSSNLAGEGNLTSLSEEESSGAKCPNQPNSVRRRRIRSEKKVKWLKHYSSDHRILLVGEGDFSFSRSLAMTFGDASNIVATSLDSCDVVIKKYKGAKTNLENLHSLGAQLLHEVDALQMKLHRDLQMQKFDRIIFNFPHAGFLGLEDDQRVIKMHRNLVCGFLKNASGMLRPKGEVHVTHKTSDPFQSWNIEELATQNSLILLELMEFKLEDYPGYSNKRGDGKRSDASFPLGECSTYKFVLFSKGNPIKEDGLCNCDPPLRRVEHISWSKNNPNRRFMGCPKYKGPDSEHCKSIDWIDPSLSGRYKKAMYEIRRERDEKEKLIESLTHQRKEKEVAIAALVIEKIQKEKLTESLTHQRKEKDVANAALAMEKIQKEKLTEALKSQSKEMDSYKEKLMESQTRRRNEKEAGIEALRKEKIQKEKLMESVKSLNKEIDAYKIWMNKLYKRCLMIFVVLVVSYWCS